MVPHRWHVALLFLVAGFFTSVAANEAGIDAPRRMQTLEAGWRTAAFDRPEDAPAGVEGRAFDDRAWTEVSVPHNWDMYEGFRQVRHGDRHGSAWYRRTFVVPESERGRRVFLFFEGVGSYATVWVNGQFVGRHAGGLTTFTLDITNALRASGENLLVVRADHPAGIRDLPWVCGGCERAYGFSEGTQPFGIFRPVHLVTTAPVRVEPFGVHVWNDADVNPAAAQIHVRTEVKNYDAAERIFTLRTRVFDYRAESPNSADPIHDVGGVMSPHELVGPQLAAGSGDPALQSEITAKVTLAAGEARVLAQEPPPIANPQLWSPTSPHLYALESELVDERGAVLDRTTTTFGIRIVHWPSSTDSDGRLLVNGQPVFINGICDYEHNVGASHAFTGEQIHARVREIESAGFNAFRDAHHPHNLQFQRYWDADGLLWWTQFGAHVWFDNDAFRTNFKTLLRDWVKERRNSPSLVLWGLQNESVLPTAFAEECSAIIRELDPTASSQRKITTCNGGTGTDWDVPQNWTGTYGGDPLAYADDLRRQKLVGEYGAWRSLGLHTEGGFQAKGPLSEDRMTALMETKLRLAESVRNEVAGHFMWLFTTHSNPGRNVGENGEQAADGIRPLDQIGPANNKGLFTIWGEPLDAYSMYRSNYASAAIDPMVHIVSHTWPDRWTEPGRKSGIVVYSNCDEVELFNDLGDRSLGRRTRQGRGTHFTWDDVEIATNILYAEGRVGGQVVARDIVTLHHLPEAPRFAAVQTSEPDIVAPQRDRTYVYRVNCGGPDYVDVGGNRWLADREYRNGDPWGSISWAAQFPNLDPRFGSQRKIYDPIGGTRDPALFQTFRYGRDRLRYVFEVPNGDYETELYFIEPWYGATPDFRMGETPMPLASRDDERGTGVSPVVSRSAGILPAHSTGWRLFDVAINGRTELRDVDLAREAGRAHAVKKIVPAHVTNGRIEISFPRIASGQAVISAIAIARPTATGSDVARASRPWSGAEAETHGRDAHATPTSHPTEMIENLIVSDAAHASAYTLRHALDTGVSTYADTAGGFTSLPADLLESDWIQTANGSRGVMAERLLEFNLTSDATVFVARADRGTLPGWLGDWEPTGTKLTTNAAAGTPFAVYRKAFARGASVALGGNVDSSADDAPMYDVFIVPRRPAPPLQLVRDLKVGLDLPADRASEVGPDLRAGRVSEAGRGLRSAPESNLSTVGTGVPALPQTIAPGRVLATGNLRVGREIFTDADTRLVSLPANLTDCDLIALPRNHPPSIEFTVSDHVEVYVAIDARANDRPAWLADWVLSRDTIATSDSTAPKYILLRKRSTPDQHVRLGGNESPPGGTTTPYFVIVRAVRPALFLEAETAALTEAEIVRDVSGATSSAAVKLSPGPTHAIEWTVAVGVGDRYGINLRYTSTVPTPAIAAELAIIGADGRTLSTDKLEFPAIAQPGAWSVLRTRTGSSINAGTYRFRLTLDGGTPLIVDSLEVE